MHQEDYMTYIIENSLHIDRDDFLCCVKNGDCYENTLYRWIIKLYKKGTPSNAAIQMLYRARFLYMYHTFKNARQ